MRRITYLPLVVPAFLSMGQVVNQVVPEPEPAAEFVQRSHQGTGSAIVVDGAPVETKADPPCWPVLGDDDEGHRFIACGNGTVHDTVTALIWLENANCFVCEVPGGCQAEDGERNWFDASVFAADLAAPQCGLMDHSQPGDWRLPTTEEVEDVFESSCSAPKIVGKAGGCHSDASGAWAESLQSSLYWSASTEAAAPANAWFVSLDFLVVRNFDPKTTEKYVWPVRGGE